MKNFVCDKLNKRYPEDINDGFGILDYVFKYGTMLDAILYATLLWPKVVEYKGLLLLDGVVENPTDLLKVEQGIQGHISQLSRVEEELNSIRVVDMFSNRVDELSVEQELAFLKLLKEMWEARFTTLFPSRRIRVTIQDDCDDEDDVAITFCQVR